MEKIGKKKSTMGLMDVGDMVKWVSDAPLFKRAQESYCNPGIVIEVLQGRYKKSISPKAMRRAVVCWADGSVTTEHEGFLKVVLHKE